MIRARPLLTAAFVLTIWASSNLAAWTYHEGRDEQKRAAAIGVPYDIVSRFEERTASAKKDGNGVCGTLPVRLYRPPHTQRGRLYPVILYLHGSGSRGSDNLRQLLGIPTALTEPRLQAKYSCFVIVPQCPEGDHWSRRSFQRYHSDCDSLTGVVAAVDQVLNDFPADPDRVYLIGYSMGAFGAWELAAREPDRFASVIPIAGGDNPEWADLLVDVPIRAVHGGDDDIVPVSQSREMIAAVRAAGGSPRYDEIVGEGHAVCKNMLADPFEFMG